jgi:hypothetical protein
VATTLTELEGLIEVFRKEFLNAESELKNALQRLLTRATNIQQVCMDIIIKHCYIFIFIFL